MKLFCRAGSLYGCKEVTSVDNRHLFEQFIRQNVDGAYRFAYTYMKNREDAEDVVNESVLKALRSIRSLKNPEYIKTWFYKIIVNTSLTQLRKKKRFMQLEHVEEAAEDDHARLLFDSMVAAVAEPDRTILVLRYCEGMTLAQVARVLDMNENTIKTRLYRTLRTLRADMEAKLDEPNQKGI